jgi:hypothetical protein
MVIVGSDYDYTTRTIGNNFWRILKQDGKGKVKLQMYSVLVKYF